MSAKSQKNTDAKVNARTRSEITYANALLGCMVMVKKVVKDFRSKQLPQVQIEQPFNP